MRNQPGLRSFHAFAGYDHGQRQSSRPASPRKSSKIVAKPVKIVDGLAEN